MKTLNKTVFVLLALVAISFTSCKKDDDGGGGSSAGSGTVVDKVDGSNFKSDPIVTSAVISNAQGTSSLLVTGNTMDGRNITLNVAAGFDGVGTYVIGG